MLQSYSVTTSDEPDEPDIYDPLIESPPPPPPKPSCLSRLYCSFCTLALAVTALLLFFLLPRAPIIRYVSSHMTSDLSFVQTFAFKNTNWYSMDWQDLQFDTYLCSVSGSFPWDLDCEGEPVGHAASATMFHTAKRGAVEVDLRYELDLKAAQIEALATLCLTEPYQVVFFSEGSVTAVLSSGHSFGSQVVTQISYVQCTGTNPDSEE